MNLNEARKRLKANRRSVAAAIAERRAADAKVVQAEADAQGADRQVLFDLIMTGDVLEPGMVWFRKRDCTKADESPVPQCVTIMGGKCLFCGS